MNETPLAVFARAPSSDAVKTRLAAILGPEDRRTLHRAFITDLLSAAASVDALAPELWVTGELSDPFLEELSDRYPLFPQPRGDLGARMAAALGGMIARRGRGLIVGTDLPTLPPAFLKRAARALDQTALVLGPSADGGFYLVGAQAEVPPIFEDIRYSTPHALADTLLRAREAGLEPHLLPPWYDVDTPTDLALLHAHLSVDPGAAPATSSKLFQLIGRPG